MSYFALHSQLTDSYGMRKDEPGAKPSAVGPSALSRLLPKSAGKPRGPLSPSASVRPAAKSAHKPDLRRTLSANPSPAAPRPPPPQPPQPQPVLRRDPAFGAVSLAFLKAFYSEHVAPLDALNLDDSGAAVALTTKEVVERVIKPLTAGARCRYIELDGAPQWAPSKAEEEPLWFASHAFGNPFRLVVDALSAHFEAAGARDEEAWVWLDVFAISQHDPGADLDDGQTLRKTIDIAAATLVVLDTHVLPFTRLWCLFEIGSTPQDKLVLLTHRFELRDIVSTFASIDVDDAKCDRPARGSRNTIADVYACEPL